MFIIYSFEDILIKFDIGVEWLDYKSEYYLGKNSLYKYYLLHTIALGKNH